VQYLQLFVCYLQLQEGTICIKKGAHMTVYVKDVFRNSGRFTLTLDDSMNRQKVRILLYYSNIALLIIFDIQRCR
jgi:hypothetical protein